MTKTAMKKTWWVPVLGLVTIAALAAVSPNAPAQDPTPTETPGTPTEVPGTPTEAPGTPTEAPGSEELDTFVPSEKLPADSAISFPVDI